MVVIESRCGRICAECDYFEKCGGCVSREKPVWANKCPIKSCVEEKKIEHCGQCNAFACKKLVAFANDRDYGDDGLRVEQCRMWAEEQATEKSQDIEQPKEEE
ncbi:MAG: DUF3795 domain-containing protein [Christensenellaceae bacterium]